MRVCTVSEAIAYDEKEKIPALRGRLVKVGKFKSGQNARGSWSLQFLELQDEQDNRAILKLKIWDQPSPLPENIRGRTVYIEAAPSDRGGSKGVVVSRDDYGKHVEVKTQDGATLAFPDETGQNTAPPARQQAATAPPDGGRPQGAGTAPGSSEVNSAANRATHSRNPKTAEEMAAEEHERKVKAVKQAVRWTRQKMNAYRLLLRAVDALAIERKELGKPLSEIQMQTMVSSMMIDAAKLGLFNDFPVSKEEFETILPPEGK